MVFLLPETLLPPDTAASVYIQLSPSQPFILLGAIGNEKPSAIFRVKGLSTAGSAGDGGQVDLDDMTDESGVGVGIGAGSTSAGGSSSSEVTTITLGISIEPLSSVLASLSSLPSTIQFAQTPRSATPAPGQLILANSKPPTVLSLAGRIIKNAFNYLGSFAVKADVPGQGVMDVVPLKAFQDWWVKFEKKVEFDPGVLERED